MILEQIKDNLGLIASIITSCTVIGTALLYVGKKILDKTLKPIIDKIENVQLLSDKNFLVRFLADIEQNNKIDEVEKERFYEVYKDYRELGGNSYIAHKVEKLQKEGKL